MVSQCTKSEMQVLLLEAVVVVVVYKLVFVVLA